MSALYAGLDVSDLTTSICLVDAKGKRIFETDCETTPASVALALKPYRAVLEKMGLESGSKSSWLTRELIKKKFPAICVDARLAHSALGAQRNKTDKNDARGIAHLMRTGLYSPSYLRSDESFRTRLMLAHRRSLKRSAIALEVSLRMSVKVLGAKVEKKRDVLTVKQAGRRPDPIVTRLTQTMIRARSALVTEIKGFDALIAKMVAKDPVCRRLMTVPGVGPLTALTYRAAIDDPARFSSSRAVAAYFGLTPRRKQSGQSDYSGRISRMGDMSVRAALYEAASALIAVSKSKCALRLWALRLRKEKGFRVATVACARKLAVILHRMWISGRDFDESGPSVT